MYCYEIWVSSPSYKGKSPLSYTYKQSLKPGTVVTVDLRGKTVYGIVNRQVTAPSNIAMKPIDAVPLNGVVIPKENLQLIRWFIDYYAAGSGEVTSLFLPSRIAKPDISNTQILRGHKKAKQQPNLTKEQKASLRAIREGSSTAILHGDTGTGKTRVYLELLKETINAGKSALVLVPEIGLVPSMYSQIYSEINDAPVLVYHSGLTLKQRAEGWHRIQSNQACVVIGPRSALFTPINNLGLIVVDEFHDGGYAQNNTPKYSAIRVAAARSQLTNAKLVLGSATPSVAETYVAKQKNATITRMTNPATKSIVSTNTIIVDKKDRSEFARSQILSTTLLNAIDSQLQQNQQVLLFHNRRGSARVIACTECGWRATCPNCELPLTLHEDKYSLVCHTCGHNTKPPTSCPSCSNSDIIFSSPGTKGIEKELRRQIPDVEIARFDGDNVVNERLDKRFQDIENGSIKVIIGTQVLVKGFDFKKLGLVGIIDADTSLSFPDFSSEERSYQLLRQAIGRVGRGHVHGTVIIQTLYPDSTLHHQAANKNWANFYTQQLDSRKKHAFPPFRHLLKLECTRKQQKNVVAAAESFSRKLKQQFGNSLEILGPAPSTKEKTHGGFTWQIIIKSKQRSHLLTIINTLPSGWKHHIDPIHLL